jgi:photosystem II stability/assembly factor-like uncharacterized protein
MSWLHSVFFLDQNRGWAVGSKGAYLTTTDGGRTWRQQRKPSEDTLSDVYFSDEKNGWLVCEKNVYELKTNSDPRTYLMNTKDSGTTWSTININGAEVDTRLVRAVFTRSGHGWIFGEAGAAYATSDAGQNWKRLQLPTRHLLLGGAFVDDDRGWLVGAGATIIETSDGGDTWHLSKLVDAEGVRFNATSFVDNRLGWAVGSGGKIVRTINGGRTWQQQNSNVAVDLLDVKFLNAFDGWAAGAEGTVISTFDGGLHWVVEPSGTKHPLERIFFTDRDHGWAVGFGGTIISYGRASALSFRQ